MKHMFDVEIAREYGINVALIMENINFWVTKNEVNETNYYDGYYWTYNSIKDMKKQFPYLGIKQIRTAIQKMLDNELIKKGNYNKSAYDRTMWYTMTEKGKSICRNSKMELNEMRNRNVQKDEPIPDSIPDKGKDINTYTTGNSEGVLCQKITDMFMEICKSYPKIRTMSSERQKAIMERLKFYSIDEFREIFEKAEKSDFLKGKNNINWSADFDWLMCDRNFAKVLEGKYDSKKQESNENANNGIQKKDIPDWLRQETSD